MSGHPAGIPRAGRGAGGPGRRPGGHGPAGAVMGGEKPLHFGATMRRMLAFMGQFKGRIALVLVFAIGSTVFSIVGPKVLSEATTVLFDGTVAIQHCHFSWSLIEVNVQPANLFRRAFCKYGRNFALEDADV